MTVTTGERITAAISRLTELRDSSTPGVWEAVDRSTEEKASYVIPVGAEYALALMEEECGPVDAELIAVLHATIDAQIGVLRFALNKSADAVSDTELQLVDAILSAASTEAR